MVYELAQNLGYNDYETFSRAFKKHFHFSPDDFKSIAGKVKENLSPAKIEEFIIQTFDDIENEEELLKRLKQIMKKTFQKTTCKKPKYLKPRRMTCGLT